MALITHEEIEEQLKKNYPDLYRVLSPKRYLLPEELRQHFPSRGFQLSADLNLFDLLRKKELITPNFTPHVFTFFRRIELGMPTYYLEPSLAEMLLRTKLPENGLTNLLKWPLSAFRLMLPRDHIKIDGRDVLYLDLAFLGKDEVVTLPQQLQPLCAVQYAETKVTGNQISLAFFAQREEGKVINEREAHYHAFQPWTDHTWLPISREFYPQAISLRIAHLWTKTSLPR